MRQQPDAKTALAGRAASPGPRFAAGARIVVGQQSWAGLTFAQAEVLKVCPKRYRVRWLTPAIGHGEGTESYVPHWAARHCDSSRAPGGLRA
jgi:hypothetical protein